MKVHSIKEENGTNIILGTNSIILNVQTIEIADIPCQVFWKVGPGPKYISKKNN